MPAFTLDTNCVVAIDEGRLEAAALRRLVEQHDCGSASVRVVAIAAAERQQSGVPLSSFYEFTERLTRLGLSRLEILKPPAYAGLCFTDYCIVHSDELLDFERRIHRVLFPNLPFEVEPTIAEDSAAFRKWTNAKCDVLTLLCHIHYGGDVFITSDDNFHKSKKEALIVLGAKSIMRPLEIP